MTSYSPIFADPCGGGSIDGLPLLQMPINLPIAGNHIVVPGIADKLIRVHRLKIISSFLTTIIFKSGTTPLSGPESTFGQLLDFDAEHPWYTAEPGENFVIMLDTDAQMGGTVWYTQPIA